MKNKEEFFRNIRDMCVPLARTKNQEIENRFSESNKQALKNIEYVVFLAKSQEIIDLVEETGEIAFGLTNLFTPLELATMSGKITNSLSAGQYYSQCIKKALEVSLYVRLGKGYVVINNQRFDKASELYLSIYRLIFLKINPPLVERSLESFLKKAGLCNE